jgi:hypothetical protein
VFRGRAPIRNRAAADLALSTGMRPEEWSTVLLPELGVGLRRPGEPVDENHDEGVSPRAAKRLREAMDRLLARARNAPTDG